MKYPNLRIWIVSSMHFSCIRIGHLLTSASLEGLWLTSVLRSANCCTRLRLLDSARASLANLVHPAWRQQKESFMQRFSFYKQSCIVPFIMVILFVEENPLRQRNCNGSFPGKLFLLLSNNNHAGRLHSV